MDPFITLIVLTVLVVSGVWGSIILAGLLRRWNRKLQTPGDDLRFSQLLEDHEQLETRVERLEEEIGFFRELKKPQDRDQLPGPDSGRSEGEA